MSETGKGERARQARTFETIGNCLLTTFETILTIGSH